MLRCSRSGSPGPGELILVFLVVLLLFGPKKLPGIARSIGALLQQLRRASDDFRDQLMSVDADVRTEVGEVMGETEGSYEDEVIPSVATETSESDGDGVTGSDPLSTDRPGGASHASDADSEEEKPVVE